MVGDEDDTRGEVSEGGEVERQGRVDEGRVLDSFYGSVHRVVVKSEKEKRNE